MSRATREQVFAALFDVLKTLPGITTVSRRLKNVEDVQPEQFPAAFQMQDEQQATYKGTTPTIFVWKATWLLYAYESDDDTPLSPALNALVDAATAVLAPAPGFDANTLSGLVTHAGIEGTIRIFEGVLGDRAVAVIPISIQLPGF